jgi:hypothetical protein
LLINTHLHFLSKTYRKINFFIFLSQSKL